ncbi:vWA domain-containing protein [Psychrobacter sp. APC 3350]|uniref:vWA domain-containing protein n=1 Tax=Psychrobacter sp. APC 3350 TaxID=3035195 RepID=UPI0025B3DCA4|nr:vWA domain-containing protein [Psychrobacter sp. APC 3350]MDN3454274.1 vWA domain-containing protein [Psychrobacter sp. APC 3350]
MSPQNQPLVKPPSGTSTPVEIDPIVQKTELKVALITSDEVIEGNPLIHEITLNNTPTSDTTVNVKLSDGIVAGLIGSATLGTDTATPVQVSTDNGSSWTTVNVVDGKFDVELNSGIDAFKVKIPTVNDWSFEYKESINVEASIGTQTPVSAAGIIKDFAWARVSEEGLPTGNVDEAGATSASDQTNSTTDSISLDFDANSTVTSIDYVGDLVQSGGKDISWAWDAGNSTLVGSNDNGKILDITLDSNQNYQVELYQAMDHPLSGEDVLDLKFKATDSQSNTGYFNVAVEDDSPTSTTTNLETGIKEFGELKTNITIVLDISGSTGYDNILENEKLAATRLIEEYELLGKVQVNLISFEYNAVDYGWLDSADAKGAINDLTATGGTDYSAAIKEVMYDDQGDFDTSMPEANQSVFYFLSDGEANAGNLSEDINSWKTYSHDNFDEVHAIGVGSNVSAAGNEFGSLNEISNPDNGIENGNVPLIITVIEELTDGVLNTISTTSEITYPETYIKDIGGALDFSIGADNIDDIHSFAWDISNIVYTAAADINWSLDPSNDLVLIGTDATDNHTIIKVTIKDIASSEPRYNISEVDSTAKITSLSLPFLVTDSDQDTSQSSLNIQMDTLPEIKEIRADNGPYQEGDYIDFQVVFDKETSGPSKIKVSLNQTNAESSDDADVSGLEAKINGVWTPLEVINGRATFDVASGTSVLEMRTQAVNDGVNEATETVRISAWTVFNAKDDLYSKTVEIAGDAGLDAIKQIADNSALEATFRNYNSPSYNIIDSVSVNLSDTLPSGVTIRYYDANTEIQSGFRYVATGNVIRAELEYTDSQGVLHTFCVNGAVVAEGNNQSSTIDINTTNYTPLVLDLDNDGIETVHISQGVTFDIDADGDQDKTGWVDKDDGLLVRDINHDGLINDARELFGDSTIKQDGSIATDGFDALADLDSNGDGIINADDDAFSQLQVWQDANTDGITQSGELLSLVDADVSEISLDTYKTLTENNGNLVELEGLYTNLDGETRDIHDVLFMYEENQNEALTSNSDLQLSDVLQSDTLDGSLGLDAQSQPDNTDKPTSSIDAAISATAVDIATICTDIYLATPTTDYII